MVSRFGRRGSSCCQCCHCTDTTFSTDQSEIRRSHNNLLRFIWCKIPLDGSDQFWYINHWTWGKYLLGTPGQMVTDAMAVGNNHQQTFVPYPNCQRLKHFFNRCIIFLSVSWARVRFYKLRVTLFLSNIEKLCDIQVGCNLLIRKSPLLEGLWLVFQKSGIKCRCF